MSVHRLFCFAIALGALRTVAAAAQGRASVASGQLLALPVDAAAWL